jgi:CheY-like chemotaxis protein
MSRRRVLVIDDYRDLADLAAVVLSAAGHDVRVSYDGASALALAPSFRPDVVLVDACLPGMDGFETFAALRRIPGLENVRGIVVTGLDPEPMKQRAEAAGLSGWLRKPYASDALLRFL